MNIDVSKIISPEDLTNRFNELRETLDHNDLAYVFQDNKPSYVIMTFDYYSQITDGGEKLNFEGAKESGVQDGLETLLNKIGKKMFIEYYDVFKIDDKPEELLPDTFTLNSKRSRSSSARKIFREGLQKAALKNIIESARLEDDTLRKAKRLLDFENNYKCIFDDMDTDSDKEYKIGKAIRIFIGRAALNGVLTLSEMNEMTDTKYSKNHFNLNFSVLKPYDPTLPTDAQKQDARGYNRYYDIPITNGKNQFLLCSQWVENLHREAYEKWLKNKLIDVIVKMIDQLVQDDEFTVKGLLNEYWSCISFKGRKQLGKEFYYLISNNTVKNVSILDKNAGIQVYKKG
ncbi:MAG: DUF1413 domain-containing protein [Bacillota bacterium]